MRLRARLSPAVCGGFPVGSPQDGGGGDGRGHCDWADQRALAGLKSQLPRAGYPIFARGSTAGTIPIAEDEMMETDQSTSAVPRSVQEDTTPSAGSLGTARGC